MIYNQILITIAIPYYNGINQIRLILDELFSKNTNEYEILIIDDYSNFSDSNVLKDLVYNEYANGNLRYIYNEQNLGMDLNFEKCVKESLGLYTWFFGQDDYVSKENLYYCISQINYFKPDIVFANYSVNRTWNYNSTYIFNKNLETICSVGAKEFLLTNNGNVPSFLPSLIIKKINWPKSEYTSKFYGTHFIQLAIFIYNIGLNKKWLYIGKPLAIGVIPSTGWQNSLTNRMKYYKGFIECLDKLEKLNNSDINRIVKQQKDKSFIQHIMLSFESKLDNQNYFLISLSNAIIFPYRNRYITKIIMYTPSLLLLPLQYIRKIYYKLK